MKLFGVIGMGKKNIFFGCTLAENKVIVDDATLKGALVEKGFGESKGKLLLLDLVESLFLVSKEKVSVCDLKGKKVFEKNLLALGLKSDKKFYSKFVVYSDVRERGYCIKTGVKFGFDFRVYPKGEKAGSAHTQYVITVVPESERLSMHQLSRMTRLAGNIHAKVLQAVVDSEDAVNYYLLDRVVL